MDNKQEIALLKTIAARIKEARELTKYSIHEAAEIMGISQGELRQIENGIDVDAIPLYAIQQASKAYDVSVDFLFGCHSDWEIAPEVRRERDFLSHIQAKLTKDQARIAAKLIQQQAQINTLTNAVQSLAPAIQTISDALDSFQQANPEWIDLAKSSPVLSSVSKAKLAAQKAVLAMVRQKLLPVEMLSAYASSKAA
ncbi:helix-turn-helix domain-containing protein [Methylomonas methanica]|uniref:Helix-turn-helix domain protein n=1 Tax=Methylomonas methanica (strain DSM 25384 / MC09) TaxID=857087 RepID=G0A3T3_METMM|nr:helix-turn-helix transcriptional regulator [Methylomonas methanica]AEG02705.1 helix-turn-helix domain protein [Methylomonas methanica MC09]